ncbi:MAG TPA: hypothetical protein VIL16_01125 [Trebonia sp.]
MQQGERAALGDPEAVRELGQRQAALAGAGHQLERVERALDAAQPAALTSNIGNITLIGSTVLSLITPSQTTDKPLTWVVATIVCLLVMAIAVVGVKVTIRFQGWIVLGEYLIIGVLAVWGLVHELSSHAAGVTGPSWSWFSSSHAPGGSTGLIAGVVIATFLLGPDWPVVTGRS